MADASSGRPTRQPQASGAAISGRRVILTTETTEKTREWLTSAIACPGSFESALVDGFHHRYPGQWSAVPVFNDRG